MVDSRGDASERAHVQRWMKTILLAVALGSAGQGLLAEPPSARIPVIRGETFAGETISLPEALHGKPGILVIGFTQASRNAVTQWGTWLANGSDAPKIAYFEMPVLASVPKMLRGLVAGRIKAAVADPAKPHFLPILDHEGEWRAVAQYSIEDDAYVLLVDGDGYVRWQTHGPPTRGTLAALSAGLVATHGR